MRDGVTGRCGPKVRRRDVEMSRDVDPAGTILEAAVDGAGWVIGRCRLVDAVVGERVALGTGRDRDARRRRLQDRGR